MFLMYLLIPVGFAGALFLIRKYQEQKWGWVRNRSSLKGKTYIVTGANTGLGFYAARALAKRGATVVIACRSIDRANEAITRIRQETKDGLVVPLELDLSSFESIRECAAQIKMQFANFDCLIENAGVSVQSKQFTKEKYELHFGVNHLGHFMLFKLLESSIRKNNSRVVVVSSGLHESGVVDLDQLGKFDGSMIQGRRNKHYNNSKLANFYFTREMYKQGFDAHTLCPGLCATDLFRDYNIKWYHLIMFSPIMLFYLRSAEQGAQNIIHAATDNKNTVEKNPMSGYYVRNLEMTKSTVDFEDNVQSKLWEESMKMCNLK